MKITIEGFEWVLEKGTEKKDSRKKSTIKMGNIVTEGCVTDVINLVIELKDMMPKKGSKKNGITELKMTSVPTDAVTKDSKDKTKQMHDIWKAFKKPGRLANIAGSEISFEEVEDEDKRTLLIDGKKTSMVINTTDINKTVFIKLHAGEILKSLQNGTLKPQKEKKVVEK